MVRKEELPEEEELTDEELDELPISTVVDGEVKTYANAEEMLEATAATVQL